MNHYARRPMIMNNMNIINENYERQRENMRIEAEQRCLNIEVDFEFDQRKQQAKDELKDELQRKYPAVPKREIDEFVEKWEYDHPTHPAPPVSPPPQNDEFFASDTGGRRKSRRRSNQRRRRTRHSRR